MECVMCITISTATALCVFPNDVEVSGGVVCDMLLAPAATAVAAFCLLVVRVPCPYPLSHSSPLALVAPPYSHLHPFKAEKRTHEGLHLVHGEQQLTKQNHTLQVKGLVNTSVGCFIVPQGRVCVTHAPENWSTTPFAMKISKSNVGHFWRIAKTAHSHGTRQNRIGTLPRPF